MKKLSALAVAAIAYATPALAQGDRSDDACADPLTTGSLPVEVHGPAFAGGPSPRVKMTPPEESWQEQAREYAAVRRREEAAGCPVD